MNQPVTLTPMSAADRVWRTVLQVVIALTVCLPATLTVADEPAWTVTWVLAIAAAAIVIVTALWNAISPALPGPAVRIGRTIVQVIIAVCAAVPTAAAAFNEAAADTIPLAGALAAAVVLLSAAQNAVNEKRGA